MRIAHLEKADRYSMDIHLSTVSTACRRNSRLSVACDTRGQRQYIRKPSSTPRAGMVLMQQRSTVNEQANRNTANRQIGATEGVLGSGSFGIQDRKYSCLLRNKEARSRLSLACCTAGSRNGGGGCPTCTERAHIPGKGGAFHFCYMYTRP
ncbi:hypothetical protein BDN72DRAFT_838775 [Pluteus cervinus]|uniref:Uncharacterized protein n=1 Tax=Pluteus cervinus TaxID=181527 RepID=A0ACD3AXU3_9AGAR|nr:hypothetical protein BDN72DRAFT_838775 [Pluteus cervinus]